MYEDTDGDGFRDSLEASTGSNLNDPNSTPLQQGLVAWYPFDGNASDMSGNGNHGTVNGATLGTDRHGVAGKAYSFDGVDDWILLGNTLLSYKWRRLVCEHVGFKPKSKLHSRNFIISVHECHLALSILR